MSLSACSVLNLVLRHQAPGWFSYFSSWSTLSTFSHSFVPTTTPGYVVCYLAENEIQKACWTPISILVNWGIRISDYKLTCNGQISHWKLIVSLFPRWTLAKIYLNHILWLLHITCDAEISRFFFVRRKNNSQSQHMLPKGNAGDCWHYLLWSDLGIQRLCF